MQADRVSAESLGLGELERQIQAWRETRPNTRPMPPELWHQATKAAQKLGIYPVSRSLRLNYEMLKRRMGPTGLRRGGRRRGERDEVLDVRSPGFIEVSGFAPVSTAGPGSEAVVEVVSSDGARLTIRGKAPHAEVVALIRAFRGRP
jgi:hypothetical protein